MDEKELRKLIEQVVRQETAQIGTAYLFKEQIMQMVQKAVAASQDEVANQDDFIKVIDHEIDNIKADMDLTYNMIARTLKGIPFEIFFKALSKHDTLE